MRENITIYTADDEEPNCGRCDNICAAYEFCVERCGAAHSWGGYTRTVIEAEEDESKDK